MNTLNSDIEQKLINDLMYDQSTIAQIKTLPTLVALLNNYTGGFNFDPKGTGSSHANIELTHYLHKA